MNKGILFAVLFMFMLVVPMVSASGGTTNSENIGFFKINTQFEITNYCQVGSCTYMNLTNLRYPNGTIEFINAAMTKDGQTFKYAYTPEVLGTYTFDTCGDPAGEYICNSDTFIITKTGNELKQSEGTLYFVLVIGLIIFLIVSVYGAVALPYSNHRNEQGKLIGTNDLKYLKILSIFLTYGILTWLANLMITISNNYIDLGVALGFFTVIFKILTALLYPTLIFTIIFMVIEAVRDFNINKLLNRGLSA